MFCPRLLRLLLLAALPVILAANERSDREIEQAARSSHTFHRVLGSQIDVSVHDGVAVLTGRVRDMDQSRLAEDTIAGIDGVKRVENRIQFDARQPATDEWLAVKIRSKLLVKPGVSLSHTRVDVNDGVVTLTGTAESEAQKMLTETAIKEIAGVRQVRNHLQVARGAGLAGGGSKSVPREELPPGAGLPTGRESAVQDAVSKLDDAAITAQVKVQLMANPETSGLNANVDTLNGRVVITGEAETEAQRERATRLARGVHGVADVDNRMAIKPR